MNQAMGKFGVFALPSAPSADVTDPGIDKHGNPVRKRKRHIKSKNGCVTCKERRVKCRYEDASKQDSSQFHVPQGNKELGSTPQVDSPEPNNINNPSESQFDLPPAVSSIDLDTIKLLHHFETCTCKSLIFGAELWQHQVMPLALNNRYLMHAILLIASAHLHYLHPESNKYSDAEAYHLALTLSGFQSDLSKPLSNENADTVVACSFILLHHAWSVEFSSNGERSINGTIDIGTDNILPLSAGLKNVLISVWHAREGSIFKDVIDQDQVRGFKEWAATESTPTDIEKIFVPNSDSAWLDSCDGYGACVGLGCGSIDAVGRLVPVLRAVDCIFREVNIDHLLPEIASYLLMWPGKSSDAFQKEVRENDNEALLIMLCFYTCTLRLLSKDFWWAHRRSSYMCGVISALLGKEGNPCAARVAQIYDHLKTSIE
ncbi:hypothetical protein B7463_g6232, partial [Scytalidium lignicola]